VRLQLHAAGTDRAACAHAAREGAAVLAAWSIDVEGEQPGPARPREPTARPLSRAARLHASATGAAVASVGTGVVHARRRPARQRGPLACCSVANRLLANEIGRVHRAREELDRVQEIETELHGKLEQMRARIDADRLGGGPVELDAGTRDLSGARASRQGGRCRGGKPLVDATRRRRGRHHRQGRNPQLARARRHNLNRRRKLSI
jgi:hypothetical protein